MILGPYQLEIFTDAGNVDISPRSHPMSGRYDRMRFTISARSATRTTDMLRPTFSVPEEVSKTFRPVFDIPIVFKPSALGIVVRALTFLGLLPVWLGLNFVDDIRNFLTPKAAEYLGQFSLVFFALTCVELVRYAKELVKVS